MRIINHYYVLHIRNERTVLCIDNMDMQMRYKYSHDIFIAEPRCIQKSEEHLHGNGYVMNNNRNIKSKNFIYCLPQMPTRKITFGGGLG